MTILFSGMLAGDPGQGGATWAALQYVLGFRRLGHEVVVVEPVESLTPARVQYFRSVSAEFALHGSAALLVAGTTETAGLPYEDLREVARRADVFVNVSGMLRDPELTEPVPVRVYLDLDPAFNQLWHAACGVDVGFDGHTHFVTVGHAIGSGDCDVPVCGRDWIATFPPVVLDEWPVADGVERDALTTVGNWRSYGSVEHDGVFYGQKAHALRGLVGLPTLTDEEFALALTIHPEERSDLAALAANGWRLLDPREVAGTPSAYRRFVRGSKAELGIAKAGYAAARCGWFSDRSACYLASGRPVLAQETGFSRYLPAAEGLFAFETVDDVLAALEELRGDYERHSGAAREIAEAHFDSDAVLGRLLTAVGGP